MSRRSEKPRLTMVQRLKRNLVWWAVSCAIYYGIAILLIVFPAGRDFVADLGLIWILLPLVLGGPFLALEALFASIFDAIIEPPRSQTMTEEFEERARRRREARRADGPNS